MQSPQTLPTFTLIINWHITFITHSHEWVDSFIHVTYSAFWKTWSTCFSADMNRAGCQQFVPGLSFNFKKYTNLRHCELVPSGCQFVPAYLPNLMPIIITTSQCRIYSTHILNISVCAIQVKTWLQYCIILFPLALHFQTLGTKYESVLKNGRMEIRALHYGNTMEQCFSVIKFESIAPVASQQFLSIIRNAPQKIFPYVEVKYKLLWGMVLSIYFFYRNNFYRTWTLFLIHVNGSKSLHKCSAK